MKSVRELLTAWSIRLLVLPLLFMLGFFALAASFAAYIAFMFSLMMVYVVVEPLDKLWRYRKNLKSPHA